MVEYSVLKAAINATCVALLVTALLLSSDNFKFVLGQERQQFQNYQSPTLGVGIQYPADWELVEESNDKLRFVKQEGFVTADLNVEDQSESSLSEYANTRVNELRTQRPEFQLVSNEPITISNKPAQKVVYTFEREEDGKTNKVMRIWSTNEDKLYTLAYIAESGQYDRYLPVFQRMVDSFKIGDGGSDSNTTQVQSSGRSSEDNNAGGNCDPSYPDVCIKSPPPNLNCPDVFYENFKVIGSDPHGFDGDNDGIGCESTNGGGVTPPGNGDGNCDPSYPDVCIKSPPPDLNCPDIPNKNFKVSGSDPHGFDRDSDGIGCESSVGEETPTPESELPSVCYFDPNDPECDPDENGDCPPGFGHNEDDRCIPQGKCPDGYVRADDDETGTCFEKGKDDRIKECPDGSIRLKGDTCYYEPVDECEPGYELRNGLCYEIPPEEPVDPCIEDPQSEECTSISCDAKGCPAYPIDPETVIPEEEVTEKDDEVTQDPEPEQDPEDEEESTDEEEEEPGDEESTDEVSNSE